MGEHDGEPTVPDLPPEGSVGSQFLGIMNSKGLLPSKGVLTFAAYSLGFGGFALLAWVLYRLFVCGCG